MTTAPLQSGSSGFLHVQDGLLAKEDKQLPLARHVVSTLEHFHFVKNFVFIVFVRAQEVVVGNPESQVIVGTFDVVKAVCFPVRSLIGPVQSFYDLFERTVFLRHSIVVGKSDHLGDLEGKVFAKLFCEFHGGKRIGAVAVSNEFEVFRELLKPLEGHAHGKNTRANSTVIGHLVTDDGTAGSVHDQPDVGFDAADFDVGFIGHKGFPFAIRVLIDEGFDADGRGLAVVGDLLMGDLNVIEIFECLAGFAQRQAEVDMQRQAQRHNVGVMLTEFQGRSVLRKGAYVHAEKIYRELTVDVVELVFIFAVILFQVFLIHLFEIVEIIRAFGIDALVDDKVLPFFFGNECPATVGTPQGELPGEAVFIWRKICIAYLAFQLSGFAVIPVKIRLWSATGGTGAVFRDVAFLTSGDRFYLEIVSVFKVRDQETPVPFLLDDLDFGKFVYFELLIFWRMGIIESPLFEWYISADKTDQPAVLLIKILNNRE